MRTFLRCFIVIPLAMSVGCSATSDKANGSPGGGATTDGGGLGGQLDSGVSAGELLLDPINAVVYIDTGKTPVTGGTQTFTVTETGTDVTSGATFTLEDTSLGSFAGNAFTSASDLGGVLGKTTLVTATATDGKKGLAKVTVVKLRKTEDSVTSARDYFFTVPYAHTPDPKDDILKFTTHIQQVDVAFVTDTTASMGPVIANIQSNLSSKIIPALNAAIPSLGIAVVDLEDIPEGDYGMSFDWPVKVLAPITEPKDPTSLALVQSAVGKYTSVDTSGNDTPEAQILAMHYTLTGKGFSWGSGGVPDAMPKAGTTGAVNFRPGAVPVIVLTTDVNWHNGLKDPYWGVTGPDLPQLADAFKKAGAKFVAANKADAVSTGSFSPFPDAFALSDATDSNLPPSAFDGPTKPAACGDGQCCTGVNGAGQAPDGPSGRCRLVFLAGSNGSSVSSSIVTAIQAMATSSVYDIIPRVSNDPMNADGVDATKFIDRLEAITDPSKGCDGTPRKSTSSMTYDDMIGGILAGKQTACFKIVPKVNDTVRTKEVAQFFKAFINMKGVAPGTEVTASTALVDLGDTRTVLFLVPPTPPIVH